MINLNDELLERVLAVVQKKPQADVLRVAVALRNIAEVYCSAHSEEVFNVEVRLSEAAKTAGSL